MPRRSLLSNEQRTRLFAVPVDHAEMAKHYVLGVTTRKCSECTTSGTLSELRPPVEIAAAAAL